MSDRDSWFGRVSFALDAAPGEDAAPTELCAACAQLVGADGAAMTLMGIDGQASAFYASTAPFAEVEELQFTTGNGPSVDAYGAGQLVAVDDLATAPEQWVGIAAAIVSSGVRSVLSLPLEIGGTILGAFTFYRQVAGDWSDEQLLTAQASADYLARRVLSLQARARGESLAVSLADDGSYRREVHQAAGMISVQLAVPVEIAGVRLRAWAFANNVPLVEAAERVVAGELRLEES